MVKLPLDASYVSSYETVAVLVTVVELVAGTARTAAAQLSTYVRATNFMVEQCETEMNYVCHRQPYFILTSLREQASKRCMAGQPSVSAVTD